MPRFDPNFAAAYLADNISGDNRNMTEFEEADLSGFGQSSERNMANFEAAAEEWEAVTEVEATFGAGRKDNLAVVAAPLVTMEKILHHLQEPWIEDFVAQVRLTRPRQGLAARLLACVPPKVESCLPFTCHPLTPLLTQEKTRVMATALVPLDNDCDLHLGMLRTVFRQLTGSRVDPPRYGGHWEEIGFQGTDPATDLRGVGLLGLIQATYLTTTPELIPFARSALSLARNPDQEFPFLVLSINVSRIALHALRDGLLNRLVVEDDNVWTTVNTFYAAVLHHVVDRWRRERLTITSSGHVLQEAEKTSRSSPASIVRAFERSLALDFTIESKQVAREQVERDSKQQM